MTEHESMTYAEHRAIRIAEAAVRRAMLKLDRSRVTTDPTWNVVRQVRDVRRVLADIVEGLRREAEGGEAGGLY